MAGLVPGLIGGQPGGAAGVFLVVPDDLVLEQLIGRRIVGDAFISQEGDEAFLKGFEAAFDFPFGLSVRGDAVGDAQRGEGALELGVGVEAVGGRAVAKEGQAVGVERGWRAVLFEGPAQMAEVAPSGIAGHKGGGDDFTRVVIGSEQEGGVNRGGPPRMRGGIVLPQFADGGALPTAARLGAGPLHRDEPREVLADIIGDGGA